MIKYRPDIDGLRAVAVILVMLFHFSMGFSGGFIGVDIFFVISGYLITLLIKGGLDQGKFNLGSFWMRRIRRLFPALGAMVLVNIIASYFILYPDVFRGYGKELISQVCMISNIYFAQQDGYFATASEYLPLLHTWSLAVEEQFYLIFPILLLWLNKKSSSRKQKTFQIILAITATSFVFNMFGVALFQFSNFFLIPGRAWELLLGSLIALTGKKNGTKLFFAEIWVWVSYFTLVVCALNYDNSVAFPGLAAVPVCLATAIIIHVHSQRQTSLSRVLGFKPVVYIGKISYSLYLWHWPIFVFFKYTSTEDLNYVDTCSLLIVSFVIASLSYHLIEQPIRKGALSNRSLISGLLGFTLTGIVAGIIFYKSDGLESRFNKDVLNYANAASQGPKVSNKKTNLPIPNNSGRLVPVLLWGDSHAAHLAPAFNQICVEKGLKMHVITKGGTPTFINSITQKRPNLPSRNKEVIEFISSESIKHVVLVSMWNSYHQKTEQLKNLDYPDAIEEKSFKISFDQTVEKLLQLGTTVWIMKQVPHQRYDPPRILANATRYKNKRKPRGINLQEHVRMQSVANEVIDKLKQPRVHILDPAPYFFQKVNSDSILSKNGKGLYRDADHLSPEGAIMLAPIFEPIFENFHE